MEELTWTFAVPLYPVHFQNVTGAILKHVASHVNQFVPELNALLISYQKKTLRLLTADGNPDISRCTLVPVHPELRTLYVRAQLTVSIFSPRVGMELTATVSALKSHMIVCKTDVPNVSLTIPRYPQSDGSTTQLDPDKKNIDAKLNVNDTVRVRLSAVSLHPNVLVLRGELLDILSNGTTQVQTLLEKFLSNSDDEGQSVSSGGSKLVKKRKHKSIVSQDVLKPDNDPISVKSKPEPETPKQNKRPSIDEEEPVNQEEVLFDDTTQPPKKKKRKHEPNTSSLVVGGLLKLALPASSIKAQVTADEYKVVVETPHSPSLFKSPLPTNQNQLTTTVSSFSNKPEPF